MNVRDNNFELTQEDQDSLAKIESLLVARKTPDGLATTQVSDIYTQLAVTVPRANDSFRQQLESRLVSQFEHHKEVSKVDNSTLISRPRPKVFGWLFPARPRLRKAFASLSLMIFLMAGLVITVPPVRTWAQSVMDTTLTSLGFVKLSDIQAITVQPGDPNSSFTVTQTTPVSLPPLKVPAPLSLEQAQAQVGFALKTPGYLPAGYKAKGFGVGPIIVVEGNGPASNPPGVASWEAVNGDTRLTLLQSKGNSIGLVLQNEPTTEVKVGDAKGVFVQGRKNANLNNQNQFVESTDNILAWEKDGVLYRLLANSTMSMSEMLKIAESLK